MKYLFLPPFLLLQTLLFLVLVVPGIVVCQLLFRLPGTAARQLPAVSLDLEDDLQPITEEMSATERAEYEQKLHAVQPSIANKLVFLVFDCWFVLIQSLLHRLESS